MVTQKKKWEHRNMEEEQDIRNGRVDWKVLFSDRNKS